ncbi:MAG: RluA family pseudouridine synthase [Alphaproteobacteria bacterium]|nr:MAG: RluA family pseudouridine synthase [Alphaproteobacteria bacterium]
MSYKNEITRVISPNEADMRLDRLVRLILSDTPLSALHRLIRAGKIRVNGLKKKGNYRLQSGDSLSFSTLVFVAPSNSPSISFSCDKDRKYIQSMILADLPGCVVLNKPYGMSTQGGTAVGKSLDRLLAYLDEFFAIDRSMTQGCRLVHRLDKETSGIIVVAKDRKFAEFLAHQFRASEVQKSYVAVVWGKTPMRGQINQPLVDASGKSRESCTAYTRLYAGTFHNYDVSVLRIVTQTGRKHQIRKHFSYLRHPLVGDRKYIMPAYSLLNRGVNLQLCAQFLRFQLPDGTHREFRVGLPEHMSKLLDTIQCDQRLIPLMD